MDHIPEAQNIKRAILVGVSQPGISMQDARESLEELANLAETAGFEEVERVIQNRSRLDPAYYIGSGKAEELKATVADNDVDAIVFDNDLSPTQMRNLELLTDARILDRSLLILDIFALHAQTRTAQLQVQMAHIRYIRPRLHTFNPHKARQAGGRAGETWVETSRRNIDYREQTVYAGLKRVQRQMAISRKHRKANAFQVTLVGYTNAGKSTLMRALSGEEVLIQDQLFATLTPTSRAVYLDRQKRRIVLTDSVGFIKRLPHHLFESFRATLAEAVNADLLLHVVDASHPTFLSQIDAVHEVLGKLEIRDKPILLVYNKMDRVDPKRTQEIQKTCENDSNAVAISAQKGEGLDRLRDKILSFYRADEITLDLQIPQKEGRLISQLYRRGEILEQDFDANQIQMKIRVDRNWARRWQLDRFALAQDTPLL